MSRKTAMRRGRIVAAFLTLALAACATGVPPKPPVLSYTPTNCTTTPDLAAAIDLTPDKDKAIWTVDRQISAATPCLSHHGASGPYVVFALPPAGSTRMVELGSLLEVGRIFSADIAILDAQGAVTRGFGPDDYMYRPGLYSVQFVPQDDERYVLVTSNPARVGDRHDTIVGGTRSTYIYTGYFGTNWRSGNETAMSRGFSYEGTVRANVYRPEED